MFFQFSLHTYFLNTCMNYHVVNFEFTRWQYIQNLQENLILYLLPLIHVKIITSVIFVFLFPVDQGLKTMNWEQTFTIYKQLIVNIIKSYFLSYNNLKFWLKFKSSLWSRSMSFVNVFHYGKQCFTRSVSHYMALCIHYLPYV